MLTDDECIPQNICKSCVHWVLQVCIINLTIGIVGWLTCKCNKEIKRTTMFATSFFEIVPEMWMMDAKEVEEAQTMRSCSKNSIITMLHTAGGGTGNNTCHHVPGVTKGTLLCWCFCHQHPCHQHHQYHWIHNRDSNNSFKVMPRTKYGMEMMTTMMIGPTQLFVDC